jgi:rhodanese-related sulfurtransferase
VSEVKRLSPEEARASLDEGYTYVDVRSEPEFAEGHVPGALNVPISHMAAAGLTPNPEFLAVMEGAFPKDAPLLIGCKSGGRSLKAVGILQKAGFTRLLELRTGFDGGKDAFGRPEPGWSKQGLPVEKGATAGQTYADVKQRKI